MLLIDMPWVISCSTSTDPIIVSVTIFEIFDVRRLLIKTNLMTMMMCNFDDLELS